VPVLDLHLPDLGVAAAADHVDQDLDAPEPLDARIDQALSRCLLGEIAGDGHSLAAGRGDRRRSGLEPARLEIPAYDGRPLARQQLRDLPAKPRRRARHHRDPISNSRHRVSPLAFLSTPSPWDAAAVYRRPAP